MYGGTQVAGNLLTHSQHIHYDEALGGKANVLEIQVEDRRAHGRTALRSSAQRSACLSVIKASLSCPAGTLKWTSGKQRDRQTRS